MALWLPLREAVIGPAFQAPDAREAQRIAEREYGPGVRVQSKVSYELGDEEERAASKERRLPWEP